MFRGELSSACFKSISLIHYASRTVMRKSMRSLPNELLLIESIHIHMRNKLNSITTHHQILISISRIAYTIKEILKK